MDRIPAGDGRLARRCRSLAASPWFSRAVIATIVVNTVVIALETDRDLVDRHGAQFTALHAAVIAAFGAELLVRFIAHGRAWRAFFADNWTRFDLAVFALSLVPAVGSLATIARMARVLRVARVVSVSPKLRLIVATMARSIPSLGHVGLLLGVLLFVYGVLGVHFFRDADPAHWGDLGTALLTLFQILTLEGWVELQRTSMAAEPLAWLFYGSFVLIAVFVVVNLFIAVVLSNLDQARRDIAEEDAEPTLATVLVELQRLRALVEEQAVNRAGSERSAPPASPRRPSRAAW